MTDARQAPGRPALFSADSVRAATGHVVGWTYFSVSYLALYTVVGVTTRWELAPAQCVALLWENGNRTTTSRPRGIDPLMCTSCAGAIDLPAPLVVDQCTCDRAVPGQLEP